MKDINKIKHEIIKRLKPLDLEQVILFGSYANNTVNEDSDIDLYVVTKDEFIPQSFKEKSTLNKSVSRAIRDLRSTFAIDLIVHTKAMSKNFKELNSSFSKELLNNGVSLL
ncbi:MAG: nucleotidyltransferase domain-containing protein [Cohaesibacteraceae bacterium]|nr:nucleotidyltransferase domain-containing protein [Cohaesibacteraceae bacterium]MBL4874968.1 nucleotidyltransferase domain-containing protein [Cohaesibacteraceae bacterium]PHQ92143.1 MAG: DNA polymerase subunit beta [Sulfurimonas sp.]